MEQESQENTLGDINSRIRILEGKYNLLRDRVLVINQNMIAEYKKLLSEVKLINSDVRDVKGELFKIKETVKHIVKEFEFFARKEDVKVLEKYINMWDPIKFVSEKEVVRLIKEHVKEVNDGKKIR